ncbi:MAG TPA: hypothetical protein VH114_06955 [Candidatus Acidoferrum sp.]|nr:hypothetical protein [Candidatus Acidoferrum sp.]
MRRLRLPKIAPTKTKGLFEEYYYIFVGVIFLVVAILCKAGGMSGYDAVVVGAWLAGFTWMTRQVKGYYAEKSKTTNGKTLESLPQAPAGTGNGPLQLPPGMKPMIGPQWPLKTGTWPTRPGLGQGLKAQAPVTRPTAALMPTTTASATPDPALPGSSNKRTFVYERPTLPDRKPKLPHNWQGQKDKKPKQKPKR